MAEQAKASRTENHTRRGEGDLFVRRGFWFNPIERVRKPRD